MRFKVREQDFFSVLVTYDSRNVNDKEIFEMAKKVFKEHDSNKLMSIDKVEFTKWSDDTGDTIVGRMVNNEITKISKKIKENMIGKGIPAWCWFNSSPCINELIPYLAMSKTNL